MRGKLRGKEKVWCMAEHHLPIVAKKKLHSLVRADGMEHNVTYKLQKVIQINTLQPHGCRSPSVGLDACCRSSHSAGVKKSV